MLQTHRFAVSFVPVVLWLPEAIDLAISSLSDGVEIDVQETKDGVVIVCHDASLKRIAGKKINIADVTYEELKQYDISYYFSKDHEFTYIPTLEDVSCKRTRAPFN